MKFNKVTDHLTVSPQILSGDLPDIKKAGFRAIICNRPDGEDGDQPTFAEIENAAKIQGIETFYLAIEGGKITDKDAKIFGDKLQELPGPVLAYCRSGTRSITLWSLSQAGKCETSEILKRAKDAGYDMSGVVRRIANGGHIPEDTIDAKHQIVIVGAGAAGIAVASSLLGRDKSLDIAIIDPAETHYYQPGWTMVGGGIFDPCDTVKTVASLIPDNVKWIKSAVAAFEPEKNTVILEGCRVVQYDRLIVCAGLKLDWNAIEGLEETLGKNGVTSNYRYDLAPYTWELVQGLNGGKAIFTQPPMPIKCAGAPQKAMYLSCDHWLKKNCLKNVDVHFNNAGGVIFGIKEYVPPLMEYVEKYGINLNFGHNLVRIDGPEKRAWFKKANDDSEDEIIETGFNMIHVVPPQSAPDFIKVSPLADENGWVDVDQSTLQHKKYENIYALGDCMNAPNAKTAAAARKQAPVVAMNVLHDIGISETRGLYDGYGSCPLTVERGKIVLAEFGYGGKLLPSFPKFVLDGTKPSRLSWLLKERILPPIYWKAMLKGREWMAKPEICKDK